MSARPSATRINACALLTAGDFNRICAVVLDPTNTHGTVNPIGGSLPLALSGTRDGKPRSWLDIGLIAMKSRFPSRLNDPDTPDRPGAEQATYRLQGEPASHVLP